MPFPDFDITAEPQLIPTDGQTLLSFESQINPLGWALVDWALAIQNSTHSEWYLLAGDIRGGSAEPSRVLHAEVIP